MAVRAMKAGAVDFIEKPVLPDQLLASIDRARERARDSIGLLALRRYEAAGQLAKLTPREREVMDLIIQGQSNKIIAHVFGISQRTVESHRSRLMRRAGVKSLSDLVRLAVAAE
jgi:two-component system CheB/CheR fusion protein